MRIITTILIVALSLASSCRQPTEPPPEPEPLFKPGEYGGEELDGTEHLYNLQLSPNGKKMALIRAYTPGRLQDPRDQLWVMNADGTDLQLIGYNINSVDWSPDNKKLAIGLLIPQVFYTYIFVLNNNSYESVLWSGKDTLYFDEKTTLNPRWLQDNESLLVSVWGRAYKQSYKRGIYILSTNDGGIKGPLVERATGGLLGNNNNYAVSVKYLKQEDPLSGNFIGYDFSKESWEWITDFSEDSLDWVELPRPNPKGKELIFAKHRENAWQLFMMDANGNNVRQLTERGGHEVSWSKDGRYVYFNRDVHKAPGARYIPHYYKLASEKIAPIWPNLPDSVPQFPALESQNPIDFLQIVQDSAKATDN